MHTPLKQRRKLMVAMVGVICVVFAAYLYDHYVHEASAVDIEALLGKDEDMAPPSPIPATPGEVSNQPKDTSALGGYNVLIADRGNNRVIEVTPDKQIIWSYTFKGLPPGYGADDSFFTDGGKGIIVNLERYHVIEQIDYQSKKITWQYGTPGVHGGTPNHLYSPDDAYKLPNGDISVADIKNCRILVLSPDKKIMYQYGKTRQCLSKPGYLDAPNGDTPLSNGDMLVSTILDHRVAELNSEGKEIFSMNLPLTYPSDPQLTRAGNILVAEYKNPGKIIEISKKGKIVWEYDGQDGVSLKDPSLAIELPNGNILANDDLNHRVIVIDKKTKKIVWQFGVTGKPGDGVDQLNIPDGLDIIAPTSGPAAVQSYSVGSITRHAAGFLESQLTIQGYLLARGTGYVLISDEPSGEITKYDLPVSGPGIADLSLGHTYSFTGILVSGGLIASNGNPNHLELTSAPTILK